MLSAIVWGIWAIFIGGGIYWASSKLIEETPDKKGEIQTASTIMVIVAVVIPFLLHLLTA
ncbi:hypothetical protein PQC55_gp068 [Escherichia phage vB_EcoP-CHD5UKE1]|uniref:Uncharacterized protein n=1 Tax=Escherichia phage vB_EcoP-CHD5UKE1 TaxID=2865805 RepID=A0ABX9AIL9_9CAUD|nr:hypothetical protein PQC55_gp068 [Escherichia phage vB_EcoP-CHD5UKE1]QZI80564.1 hypothetical protein CHD5UKE1_0068 [Escherichia phage vB_EcoP-CHD5UKE1]